MNERDRWVRETLTYICPFATREWFDHRQDVTVFVSAYRVYRVPLKGAFSLRPLVADLESVRAVFLQWDAPYKEINPYVVEHPGGQLDMQFRPLHTYRTGDGVLLLLMTPLPEDYGSKEEDVAREKIGFTRSAMVALLGRNAAYKHEFNTTVECGNGAVANPSLVVTTPADEIPIVNEEGVKLVGTALDKLSALDDEMQNRVRLALRWYQRSFGDDRLVRDTIEEDTDKFINSWLAWETLAMERYNDHISITRMLAGIHGLEVERIGELFPIGRIYGLRGEILHRGRLQRLNPDLPRFMTDIFVDLLRHVLCLPSGQNTEKYLDGSATKLVEGTLS